MSLQDSRSFASRKSHRKSRGGCDACKLRKVKCDEGKPSCLNCTRRSVKCEYAEQPATKRSHVRDTSTQHVASPSLSQSLSPIRHDASISVKASIGTLDLELFHHFITCTANDIGEDEPGVFYWQIALPKLCFKYRFMLDLALAMAAIHRAYDDAEQRDALLSKADENYARALPIMIEMVPRLDNDDQEALFGASLLLGFCYFAKGPPPHEYLIFSDQGESAWYPMFTSVKLMNVRMQGRFLEGHQAAKMLQDSSSVWTSPGLAYVQGTFVRKPELGPNSRIPPWKPNFRQLRDYMTSLITEDSSLVTCLGELQTLEEKFRIRYSVEADAKLSPSAAQRNVMSWVYTLSDEFIGHIQRHHAIALIIYGYYTVALSGAGPAWMINRWPQHLLNGVIHNLPEDHRHWLHWAEEYLKSST